MSKTQIPTGGIADDAISEEHIDATALTGNTALEAQPASDDEVLISDAGTLKKLDIKHIQNTPAFHASSDNTLSVSTNTNTDAACNVEAFDSDSKYDTSTFRFTPGVTGKYFFYIQTRISESSGRIQVALYKNGSVLSQSSGHIEMENSGAGNNSFTGVNGSCITNCTSTTDYFEAFVWHKDGSTKNMTNRVFLGFRIAGI